MERMLARMTVAGLIVGACACGGSNGPTSTAPSTAAVAASASTANQAVSRPERIAGEVSNLGGACPTLSFKIGSTTVSTSTSTSFPDGNCAAVANGSMVEVDGTPQPDGSVAATQVRVAQPHPQAAQAHGAVSGLTGTCPTVTFMVGTSMISTTSDTTFGGAGCAALANGSNVAVTGTLQTGGSILAAQVFLETAPKTPPAFARGVVSALAGACPTVTFTLGTTAVSTTSGTTFVGGACAGLADGSPAGVEGTRQPDGSIVANRVFVAPGVPRR
jgi:hypothetical protein